MKKQKKNVLYNIFDINNNINAEININRPISHKKYISFSNNKKNHLSNSSSKYVPKMKSRNQINYKNKNNNNYYFTYNNIISDNSNNDNKNYANENMFISESNNLIINKNKNNRNDFSFENNFSNSSKIENNEINFEQNQIEVNDNDDEILSKKYKEIKKLHKLFDENIELKNEIKYLNEEILNIKNINKINKELINNQGSQIYYFDENSKKLKEKINELSNINKNNIIIISKLKKEKNNLEQKLILAKKDLINKNDIINCLNEKCRVLQDKINEIILKNNFIRDRRKQEEKNLEKIQKDIFNKLNENNSLFLSTARENNYKINLSEPISIDSKEKQKKNNLNIQNLKNFDVLKIQERKNKVPSTPSFKSQDSKKDEDDEEEIEEDKNLSNKKNNIKEKDNENLNMKYYENRYLYYFKLYQECRKNREKLEKENEEKEKLIQKFIKKINEKEKKDNKKESNNLINTIQDIKSNNQYNSNEYFIKCDKTLGVLKWYLLKKRTDYKEKDTYENLIWVPKVDIVEIDQFNNYSSEDEIRDLELLNVLQKLEEKENIISKLEYKIEKLEKDIEYYKNNSTFSDLYDELFVKTKSKNKNNKKEKKS